MILKAIQSLYVGVCEKERVDIYRASNKQKGKADRLYLCEFDRGGLGKGLLEDCLGAARGTDDGEDEAVEEAEEGVEFVPEKLDDSVERVKPSLGCTTGSTDDVVALEFVGVSVPPLLICWGTDRLNAPGPATECALVGVLDVSV